MSINHSIPLFQTLHFKVHRSDTEWYATSVGDYDTLGTTIEITAPSRLDLHQQLYVEISEIFFGVYEVDVFVQNEHAIDILLTQDSIPMISGRKYS